MGPASLCCARLIVTVSATFAREAKAARRQDQEGIAARAEKRPPKF